MTLSKLRILLPIVFFVFAGCDSDTSGTQADATAQMPGEKVINVTNTERPARSVPAAPPTTTVTALDQSADASTVKELDWDALLPTDWNPEQLMEQYDASGLSDSDPKAKALLEKIRRLWDEAPVVESLDGQHIKLPGFVVPLEMDAKSISEFLLVPYYGACVHVPPPPTNQTVRVIAPSGRPFEGELFDTIWVTGEMKVEAYSNDVGDAGYSIHATTIEPYE